jgi:hypothetical protein
MAKLTEEKQASQLTQKVVAAFQTVKKVLCTATTLVYSQTIERLVIIIHDRQM